MENTEEIYTDFARVYDELMDNTPYEMWCERLDRLIAAYGVSKPERDAEGILDSERNLVVDLGCGTGTLTEMLYQKGYDCIGLDNSEEMLNIAMDKKAESGSEILYLHQDMRELELFGNIRAIVSVCDSMNYILEPEDLKKVFERIGIGSKDDFGNPYEEWFISDYDVYGGRLPVHVRCLIDECANIGQIPKLEKLVATIRSREISACLVLQAQSQLKAIYKDNADTIIGNMDTSIFLGGKEPTTLKELAAVLGKETIDTYNTGESRGRETSHSLNYQKLGKELMTQDEIAVMDGGKCILQLRGVRPFFSDKYDITQHPNYKYLSDFDKKNAFDVERYMSTRPAIVKPDEPFDIYEIDLSDEDAAAE